MELYAVKKNGSFVIPMLDNVDIDIDQFCFKVDAVLERKIANSMNLSTKDRLIALNARLGGDEYLTYRIEHMNNDFSYTQEKTDQEILMEALLEKHGE
jgi:hypothetical protein